MLEPKMQLHNDKQLNHFITGVGWNRFFIVFRQNTDSLQRLIIQQSCLGQQEKWGPQTNKGL